MFRLHAKLFVLSLGLITLMATLVAQADSPREEIIIRAERATLNQKTGSAQYEGNAELIQGDRRMNADKITLTIENDQPTRIEASGNPVTLEEASGAHAQAQRIVYDLSVQRIWLYENASISHQGRLFEGAELEYHLDTEQVNASGNDGGERVKLVIPAESEGNP